MCREWLCFFDLMHLHIQALDDACFGGDWGGKFKSIAKKKKKKSIFMYTHVRISPPLPFLCAYVVFALLDEPRISL